MICPWERAGAACDAAGALLLGGNSRGGCWMGLGLLVLGVGARAIGGKLGLGVAAAVLMGGGGRGGKLGVAAAVGVAVVDVVGDVVGAGTGLGVAPASIWGCWGAGVNCGLVGAVVGAVAVVGEVLGRSSIFTIPAVIPTLAIRIAAIFSHGNALACVRSRLRLGRAMTSAAQSSSAVAKSKSWRVLKCTSGPDSAALKEPKNKLWASKPRGSRRGGTGR
jgi:hypothetical protein